jgi:inhibitor of KinA sporulation pathway (predicted exonuclease)
MTSDDIHYSHTLYIDREWTCWNVSPPPGMKQEIIEIGVVEMNLRTLEITQEAAHFVRPRRWEISAKCTNLTGITEEDIRKAKPLDEVLATLTKKFRPGTMACCAWGDDIAVLQRACKSLGLMNPFRHPIDLSRVFEGIFVTKEQAGLGTALKMLGLDFDGVPHGALPDARNAARLHASILRRMRRVPEPAPPSTDEQEEIESLSTFGQKLIQSLKY